ncbi:N-acetyltransferase [Nakamurella antarctica]|uniref:N-acetyltransferase n=1 Tax=Nakamurella antarctica TaxID=1902245 RepID=A0A3G8ZK64_9ACTN|nr:GNAT family N-acetyltransferase [Nakamurella antarctica]AZI57653.1 N-acetyltransferase [Nakamurella antarctica]
MTVAAQPYRVMALTPAQFRARVDELLGVYVAAMGYPAYTHGQRRPLWLDHSNRVGFHGVVALDKQGSVLGMCFGYTGAADQWWHGEVRRGLTDTLVREWFTQYRELTELHVRPDTQGAGIGEALVRAFLAPSTEDVVLLSTPEGENRAWRLYRRLGFVDVLRRYQFAGDPRPFAILGRALPLPADRGLSADDAGGGAAVGGT